MSFKYSILNVSYDQPTKLNNVQIKNQRSISRYSNYAKKNNFNILPKPQTTINQQFLEYQNQRFSIYQQYKKKQYLYKLKIDTNKTGGNNYSQFMVRGFVKDKNNNENNDMTDFNLISIGEFPYHQKQRLVSPRRKFSIHSQGPRSKSSMEKDSTINAIGILGVRTSFLDKYKIKFQNPNSKKPLSPDIQSQNKINRREFLCSTKRNRTLQLREIQTSKTGRHIKRSQYNKNNLSLKNEEKMECRPWSPSRDDEFQKL